MTTPAAYYDRAGFRSGVDYLVGDSRAVFTYDELSFDVDLNAPAADQVERICSALVGDGLDPRSVEAEFGAFTPHAYDLLAALDKYGFLTERGTPDPITAISGAAFWQEVESFANRAKARFRPVLFGALSSGTVPRGALVRYAHEYFHLVRAGPSIIAGSLAHVGSQRTQRLLQRFLVQEVGHDVLLARALSAAGFRDIDIDSTTALPETFALVSGLQVLADQDPLAFKAVAYLLEEANPEFHSAFVAACERVELGPGFWSPIVRHAEMNDDGDHGTISGDLLAEVAAVSTEERTGVLRHVASMIESLVALEHAVLEPANALG